MFARLFPALRRCSLGILAVLAALACTVVTARADNLPQASRASIAQDTDVFPVADRVVVRKSERRLYLMRGSEVLRSYRVALGADPVGHKQRAGDSRTPEGTYQLARRNPRSDYFLSIQVSYPSPNDARSARKRGWDPGGSIMIHGLPNNPRFPPDYYARQDWTDGCIAVSNADMVEIWMLTRDNIPIEIRP
jgi:murein L,D-transpeptidase YafK